MKRLTLRWKMTFWFSAMLAGVALLSLCTVFAAYHSVERRALRDKLIETVENNVDEVEFYASYRALDSDSDADHAMAYSGGFLEIDDDFLDAVNGVTTALYAADGEMLYGENPLGSGTELPFVDSVVRETRVGSVSYFLFDRASEQPGLENLWLRGVVAESEVDASLRSATRLALIGMPLLLALAAAGGYWLTGRALRPIGDMARTASRIGRGSDLGERIELTPGDDEVHRLADAFNQMFSRLEASFEAERRFTADASHELRTPLSVLLAQCESALSREGTAEECRQALHIVQRQGGRMNRLIGTLLECARFETGAGAASGVVCDWSASAADLCEDLALAGERGISLHWDIEPDIHVGCDAQTINRVLANLVGNAYKYGRDNGNTWVRLQKSDGKAILTVRDDGPGFPPGDAEAVFRRFWRADASRSEEGAGLGLFLMQEIVRSLGGQSRAESAPGKGATFVCSVPLALPTREV